MFEQRRHVITPLLPKQGLGKLFDNNRQLVTPWKGAKAPCHPPLRLGWNEVILKSVVCFLKKKRKERERKTNGSTRGLHRKQDPEPLKTPCLRVVSTRRYCYVFKTTVSPEGYIGNSGGNCRGMQIQDNNWRPERSAFSQQTRLFQRRRRTRCFVVIDDSILWCAGAADADRLNRLIGEAGSVPGVEMGSWRWRWRWGGC